MRRLLPAIAAFLCGTTAAYADPVTLGITAAASWYASIGVAGQLLVQVGISLALSAAAFGISYLLAGSGRRQQQAEATPVDQGIELPEFSGLLRVRRVYGTVTVTGGVFFHKTVAVGGSAPNHWLLGLAVSEGICDSLVSVIINGIEVPLDIDGNPQVAPWYNPSGNYLKASFRSGTDTQAIDPIILSRFPSPPDDFYPDASDRVARWAEFRQRGVCTVVLDMMCGADRDEQTELWGAGGIPEIKLRVKGLHLYDRTDPNQDPDDSATWAWSENATVCIEDYLCAEIGGQVDRDAVADDASRVSAAIDAEWVPTLAGQERRGRVNGAVSSDESPVDVLSAMAMMNRGQITKAQGEYRIRSDRPAEAVATIWRGQWRDEISETNQPDKRAAISGVVAQFYPATRFGEAAETAYPGTALDEVDATRVTFRFGDSAAQVQRLGYAMLTENGVGRTVSGVFDVSVLVATGKDNRQIEVGDVVNWDPPSPYDDMAGLYRVDAIELRADFKVSLSLTGTTPTIITGWSTALETALEEAA